MATLKPGELPYVFDTTAPEMHPATIVSDGYVGVDASKCTPAELAEVEARYPRPNIYTPPESTEAEQPEQHHERRTASRTTTVTVSRTTTR